MYVGIAMSCLVTESMVQLTKKQSRETIMITLKESSRKVISIRPAICNTLFFPATTSSNYVNISNLAVMTSTNMVKF